MKKDMLGKALVLGVIILFIGVGIQPAFAVNLNILSNEDNQSDGELIEVTFRICKFIEIIENTVLLTQEESNRLDNILNNVKKDLENAKDIDEEKEIYNNAIISFNDLGLLPENINHKELQKVVSNDIYQKLRNKVKSGSKNNYESDGFYNEFCTISGESDMSVIFSFISLPFFRLTLIFPFLLSILCQELLWRFYDTFFFGGTIALGYKLETSDETRYLPATGWIHTNGDYGEQNYEGEFYGQLYKFPWMAIINRATEYMGVSGFTGIQIYKGDFHHINYMGTARKVHIGTEPLL